MIAPSLTPQIDKALLLNAAKLSSIVYLEDVAEMQKEMEALGYEFLGLVTNGKDKDDQGDHQVAILRAADKRNVLVCRGTQVEENFSLSELLDDANTTLIEGLTFEGFTMPESVVDTILHMINPVYPIDIYGHSKGGSESHLLAIKMPIRVDAIRIISFGAPACAVEAYYTGLHGLGDVELIRVVAMGDFAPGWGLDSNGWQPYPCVVLEEGKEPYWFNKPVYKTLLHGGLGPHSITNSYIKLLGQ